MTATDVSRAKLQSIIAELQAFAATLVDVAEVSQIEDSQSWRLTVVPHVANGCPIEMMIQSSGTYDLRVDGQGVEDQPLDDEAPLLAVFRGVADGRVIRRSVRSEVTAIVIDVQTRVTFAGGGEWVLQSAPEIAAGLHPAPDMPTVDTDQYYLPYRRTNA